MGRIDGKRRQNGKDLPTKLVIQPWIVFVVERIRIHDNEAGACQRVAQLAPGLLLVCNELRRDLIHAGELLRGRKAIVRQRYNAGIDHAFQACDADHIKFIEV